MLLKTTTKFKASRAHHRLHHPLLVVQALHRQTARHHHLALLAAALTVHRQAALRMILQALLMIQAQAANRTQKKTATTSFQDNKDANRSKMKRKSNVKLIRPRATNSLKHVNVVAFLSTNKSNC